MVNLNNKYRNTKYTPLGSVIKKELDEIEDLVQENAGQHEGFLQKDVHDKDGNNIIDMAETLSGLMAKIEELNMLVGATSNIQEQLNELKARKPKIVKTVHTITTEPDQFEFIFDRDIESEVTVELRSNSTWIHDDDYIVANNRIILKRPFPIQKTIDFIFYEATY